ncbi:hypothetical protein L6164_021761 [Bauhinia variegata]|uniref:Uncharacterized protein n=1 Tax=Bauhinia variegata TaxID=167791 RepID=A0ACB9MCJ2_BAUVA|nr:hypothetical protein L6164_021761 [Bauhinia variegata]
MIGSDGGYELGAGLEQDRLALCHRWLQYIHSITIFPAQGRNNSLIFTSNYSSFSAFQSEEENVLCSFFR